MNTAVRTLLILLALLSAMFSSTVATAQTEIGENQYIIFYHHDALGNPVAASDHNGNILWHQHHEPFGRARDRVMPTGKVIYHDHRGSRKGYTGHLWDSGTDLVYMKARFYDPLIGRFYSNDPVGFNPNNPASFNRYAYVNNNPYRYVDPNGKNWLSIFGGGNGGDDDEDYDGIPDHIDSDSTENTIHEANLLGNARDGIHGAGGVGPSGFINKFSGKKRTKEYSNGGDAPKGAGAFSKVAPATAKQLQKKFKHAGDFGVSGNYNRANAQQFNQAIQKHLNASGTKEISGTYRGNSVTFHTNPNSGLTVIQNPNGSFLSGWKLNPQQLQHVLKDGKL